MEEEPTSFQWSLFRVRERARDCLAQLRGGQGRTTNTQIRQHQNIYKGHLSLFLEMRVMKPIRRLQCGSGRNKLLRRAPKMGEKIRYFLRACPRCLRAKTLRYEKRLIKGKKRNWFH